MNRGRGGGGRCGGGRRYHGSRGRSPQSAGRYVEKYIPVGIRPKNPSLVDESGSSGSGKQNSEILVTGVTEKFNSMLMSDHPDRPSSSPNGVGNISPGGDNSKHIQDHPEVENHLPCVVSPCYDSDFSTLSCHPESNASIRKIQSQDAGGENSNSSSFGGMPILDVMHNNKETFHMGSGFQDARFSKEVQSGKSASKGTSEDGECENSNHKGHSFDICLQRGNVVKLKSPLFVKNRAKRNETKRQMEGDYIKEFRSGMILLKGYLTLMDQVNLIKACRDLGRGSGGFYEPGYRDGATLHLKMMCLGKHWDPQASIYVDERPVDGARPPPIPDEFQQLVKGAIQECHNYLESHSKARNARDILPSMSPNVCIINYYTTTGKLGLHQDKDESQETLRRGLPVVSFSIGDTANFLYGDLRDIDKAEKVLLESGDVLIFGGKSRNIFHGVTSIIPDTAPPALLEETNFRKGRLNLTFREY